MGQLEKYGLYVLCLVIFLILGVTIWGDPAGQPPGQRNESVPIYLPELTAERLPMLSAFPVVAAVELRPREDSSEPSPDALLALAVARVVRGSDLR